MGKRRNDNNQVSKEDYEAQQLRDEMEGEEDTINPFQKGFSRASADVLKKRRIARVGNRFKRQPGGGAGASAGTSAGAGLSFPAAGPTSSSTSSGPSILTPKATAPSTGTKNPFGSISLTTTQGDDESSKPNPFASIGFASSSATPSSNFNFAPSSSSAPAVQSSGGQKSMFSFATKAPESKTLALSTDTKKAETASNSATNGKGDPKLSEGTLLNIMLLRMIQMEAKANPFSDYTEVFNKYSEQAKVINEKEMEEEKKVQDAGTSNNDNIGAAATSTATATAASTSSSSTFKFSLTPAASAPAPTLESTSTTTAATKSTTIQTNKSDDPDKIAKVINEDDEELYECKARYRKFITVDNESKWKSFASGTLRLTKSKSTQKSQMVIRNEGGKVQFNIMVSKGMKFVPRKDKGKGHIQFVAIQDEAEGAQTFMVTVKIDDLDGLMEHLNLITG